MCLRSRAGGDRWLLQGAHYVRAAMTHETLTMDANFVQVQTSVGDRQDAERIASRLVARRLAACVQISGPISSVYQWQGSVETASEWLCVAKTKRESAAALIEEIRKLHPYELPEIIVTPILGGSTPYLNWIAEETRTTPADV
jgi:periplasmic divalent cation tolerance protein